MNKTFDGSGAKIIGAVLVLVLAAGVWAPARGQTAAPGIGIDIALSPLQPDFRFALGAVIGVTLVIKKTAAWPVYTDRGFSQSEFYQALILTDPAGKKYKYIPKLELYDTMPPTLNWGDRSIVPAESLPDGVLKTVIVKNLSKIFPVVATLPGWYKIQAQQPFKRFAETLDFGGGNLWGYDEDVNNWSGAVNSSLLSFYLYPPAGALARVQVLDQSGQSPQPVFQAPVKIFKKTDGYSLQDYWSKAQPALSGSTDTEGYAAWQSQSACLSQADYVIIALYGGDYSQAQISADSDQEPAWQPGCQSTIERRLFVGAPPAVPGDLTGDGLINAADYTAFRSTLGKCTGDAGFIPEADYDGDGCVTYADYRIWFGYYRSQ